MLELEAIFGSGAPVPGYAVWGRLTPCSDMSLATLSVIEWRVPRGRPCRDNVATIDTVPLGAIATLGTVP
jgi:hypothetical protein